MSEAAVYEVPECPSNIGTAWNIGIRVDYRAAKQREELFNEAPSQHGMSVAASTGIIWEYSSLGLLKEQPEELQPQYRNMDEVHYYYVGTGRAETDEFISVFDLVGSRFCLASDSGHRLYNSIRTALIQGKRVYLSFRDITNLSPAFLDAAIGQLYNGEFSDERINENISLTEISPDKAFLVRRAIHEAKEFYRDPERFRIAIDSLAAEGELD